MSIFEAFNLNFYILNVFTNFRGFWKYFQTFLYSNLYYLNVFRNLCLFWGFLYFYICVYFYRIFWGFWEFDITRTHCLNVSLFSSLSSLDFHILFEYFINLKAFGKFLRFLENFETSGKILRLFGKFSL